MFIPFLLLDDEIIRTDNDSALVAARTNRQHNHLVIQAYISLRQVTSYIFASLVLKCCEGCFKSGSFFRQEYWNQCS